ncbi:ECF transporter S component [Brevibacillus massiliensis]|jgi:riboflavin transporter FmnP|uniref:ECF transporter S component n=1 Tax=Brevibacillus massiliensis TaxID=1118054 RepID=UPI0002D5AB21|nr:ECF transporter S component [Brevibacillus massiliensis]
MQQQQLYPQQMMQTKRLVFISLLSAVAFVLMYLEFQVPLFPSFLKLDLSTLPGLLGGLVFGPAAGLTIELIKNVLHLLLKNTDGLLIGELANFLAGSSFILAAVWVYRRRGSKAGFALGLSLGTLLMTVIMSVANYYLLIPAYAVLYNMSVPDLLANFHMNSLWSLIIYGIAPFNVIKGIVIALIAAPIMMKVMPHLRAK